MWTYPGTMHYYNDECNNRKDRDTMVKVNIYNVPDIVPGDGFSIEIVDAEQKPIAKARLKASLDGAAAKPVKSDEKGIVKVKTGPDTKSITLLSADDPG
jgi:hypothetical protein